MRVACIFPVVFSMLLLGCRTEPAPVGKDSDEVSFWRGHTILPEGDSIPALNARANDLTNSQAGRAEAVFILFAHYVRPGASAAEMHQVLTDTSWLRETKLYDIRMVGGWIPIEFADTVFCIHLFPADKDKGWSPWVIYFRSSGKGVEESREGIREEQELSFLRGESTEDTPRLLEFALCFPNSKNPHGLPGRIERFSRQGVHVYEEQ